METVRRMMTRWVQAGLIVVAIFVTMGATDSNARFERLGHKLMCQCGCSQVLLECNHVGCTTSEKMRAELTAMLNGGDNDNSILQKFVDKYGPVVLAAPTQTGFNRMAWIMPYLALIVGIGLCAFIVRTWNKRRAPVAAGGPELDSATLNEYRERIHQETEQ